MIMNLQTSKDMVHFENILDYRYCILGGIFPYYGFDAAIYFCFEAI